MSLCAFYAVGAHRLRTQLNHCRTRQRAHACQGATRAWWCVLTCSASVAARLAASWPCAASTAARAEDSWVCSIRHGTANAATAHSHRVRIHAPTTCLPRSSNCTTQSIAFSFRLAKARRGQLHPCRAKVIPAPAHLTAPIPQAAAPPPGGLPPAAPGGGPRWPCLPPAPHAGPPTPAGAAPPA